MPKLHDEPQPGAPVRRLLHPGVVDGGNSRQFQLGHNPDLAQEPLAVPLQVIEDLDGLRAVWCCGHVRRGPQHLDRDTPVQPLVVAVVNLAHAALAEQPVDPVPPGEQFPLRLRIRRLRQRVSGW
jgi:hypothetical protein